MSRVSLLLVAFVVLSGIPQSSAQVQAARCPASSGAPPARVNLLAIDRNPPRPARRGFAAWSSPQTTAARCDARPFA